MPARPSRSDRRRYRRADLGLIALILVVVAGFGTLTDRGAPRPAAAAAPSWRFSLVAPAGAPRVPNGFLGLSLEYGALAQYAAGTAAETVNPVFTALLRDLAPSGGIVLRIGGGSADGAWWPTPGVAKPPVVRFRLSPDYARRLAQVTSAVDAKLILGLNLEADEPQLAAAEADGFRAALPGGSISAFELGNEPDLYGQFGYASRTVPGRPADYGVTAYLRDLANFSAVLGGVPLAGPAANNSAWIDALPRILASADLQLVTLHRYPLQLCFIRASSPRSPSIAHLLAPAAAAGFAARFARPAVVAHRHHVPLRIDELNTVGCGADRAVSQAYAAALWAPEALFELAARGVDGVNLHTFPGAGYELFRILRAIDGTPVAAVSPEFYGLMLFARAAPSGARILRSLGHGPATLHLWGTLGTDGHERILAINDDPARAVTLSVALAGGRRAGVADAQTLRGPGLAATGGVTLGGRTFGRVTRTGQLAAARTQEVAVSGGRVTLRVPPAAAVLVTTR